MNTEQVILFAGPHGAGKTAAIASISDIPIARLPGRDCAGDPIGLDYGEVTVAEGDIVRLYGIPSGGIPTGMWRIVDSTATGLILLIDGAARDPFGDFDHFLDKFGGFFVLGTAVVGITRADVAAAADVDRCRRRLHDHDRSLPIFEIDARDRAQMIVLLMTLVGMVHRRATELAAD